MTLSAEWRLGTRHVGRRVLVFDQIDSTNAHAASLAGDPANAGLVVLAREQTAGRGQHGRSWQCPAGSGVLLSALLYPPEGVERPAVVTALAAVSVCEVIRREVNLQARIKWPNDVLLRGRKVCGILCERGRGTVVGIGLNVNQPAEAFAAAGLPQATSLAARAGRAFDCDEVARALIRQLDEHYDRLLQGDLAMLEACWKWRVGLLGKEVTAECADGLHRGRLVEAAFDGVELRLPDGRTRRWPPELVRHLHRGGGVCH